MRVSQRGKPEEGVQGDIVLTEGTFSGCTSSVSISFFTSRSESFPRQVTAAAVQRAIMESLP
jgi:hypothetical protein